MEHETVLADADLRFAPAAPENHAGRPDAGLRFEIVPANEEPPGRVGESLRLEIVPVEP